MRPAIVRAAITASGFMLLTSCSGEVPDVSTDEVLVTYTTKLPQGVAQWSECTSNGVGQVACETDQANVPSTEDWTCSVCKDDEGEDEGQPEAEGADESEDDGQSEGADEGEDEGQPEGDDEGDDEGQPEGDDEGQPEDEGDDEGDERSGSIKQLEFPKVPAGADNSLASFLEGLKELAKIRGNIVPKADELPEVPAQPSDEGKKDEGKKDEGLNKAPAQKAKAERQGAKFPRHKTSKTSCIRSGLPKGLFTCKAEGKAGRLACTGTRERKSVEPPQTGSSRPERGEAPKTDFGGMSKQKRNKGEVPAQPEAEQAGMSKPAPSVPEKTESAPAKGVLPDGNGTAQTSPVGGIGQGK